MHGARQAVAAAPHNHLRFNLSHSGPLVAIAVTSAAEVGVDVERIQPRRCLQAIADRQFPPLFADALRRLSGRAQLLRFLEQWTAYEAFVKALGTGLQVTAHELRVEVGAGGVLLRHPAGGGRPWALRPFRGQKFVGAVVVSGEHRRSCRTVHRQAYAR
jgi:phosphopantetheinyl transferase